MNDLYIITKHPCCGKFLGSIVKSDGKPADVWFLFLRCGFCNGVLTDAARGTTLVRLNTNGIWPLEWMRKLPPLDEPADTTTPRELETV